MINARATSSTKIAASNHSAWHVGSIYTCHQFVSHKVRAVSVTSESKKSSRVSKASADLRPPPLRAWRVEQLEAPKSGSVASSLNRLGFNARLDGSGERHLGTSVRWSSESYDATKKTRHSLGGSSLRYVGCEATPHTCRDTLGQWAWTEGIDGWTEGIDRDTEPIDTETVANAPPGARGARGGVGALRIEEVSIPTCRTLPMSKGPNQSIPFYMFNPEKRAQPLRILNLQRTWLV